MSQADSDLKKYELQALFDLSKALNSSLNIRTILDTLLLTPMGKLLIGKGVVLIAKGQKKFVIETLKGINRSLMETVVQIEAIPAGPSLIAEMPPSDWSTLLAQNGIEVVIPILHDNLELGVLGFGKKSLGGSFNDSDLDYLHSLSNIAATAVQNGIIFKELHETNRKLEKKVQELNTLAEIERELNSTLSTLRTDKVVNLLAYSIMGELTVNRCLICLAENGRLVVALNRGLPADKISLVTNNPQHVAEMHGLSHSVILTDTAMNESLSLLASAGVAVVVPMRIEAEFKGFIGLGEKITKMPFVADEIDFLSILGNWSMISIETARLIEQEVEKKKLEQELHIASEIQRQLLPEKCPEIEGYQLAGSNHPSLQVGGDYYDCLKLNDDEYIFCIADVSGKGAPAALLMSNLQASLHSLADTGLTLSQITARINNIIYRNTTSDKFITFFLGRLNVRDQIFTSVNAGHNPPYIFHSDGAFETLEAGGLILGMMPDVSFSSEKKALRAGDCIVMFTDGVSEAMNSAGEEFGEHRIEEYILKNHHSSAGEILQGLIEAANQFSAGCPQADDITVFTIKVD